MAPPQSRRCVSVKINVGKKGGSYLRRRGRLQRRAAAMAAGSAGAG